MNEYDEEILHYFLEHQTQLFPEAVAESPEEAEEFLEDCMAVVCKNIKEVRDYFDDAGMDVAGMSEEELLEASEVFAIPDGRFLVVEGKKRDGNWRGFFLWQRLRYRHSEAVRLEIHRFACRQGS